MAPTFYLDFLYDENDVLYGFVKDKTEKYFYVRDFLQNIIGLIDTNGKLVVKYDCTAYGKVTVLQDTKGLAEINPFLYKGYYFDRESGMFYCHTRYYVPEWCRWLNADNIAYLRIDDLTQTSLFIYCGNNPISGIDTEGTKLSKRGKSWLKIGLSIALVLGFAVATVATGGLATAIGAVCASAAIGGAVGLATGVINGAIEGKESGDYLESIANNAFLSTASGTMSGLLAQSGFGLATQVIGNVVISGGTYWASCKLNGVTPNSVDFGISVLGGGLSSLVGDGIARRYSSPMNVLFKAPVVSACGLLQSALIGAAGGEFATAFSKLWRWL